MGDLHLIFCNFVYLYSNIIIETSSDICEHAEKRFKGSKQNQACHLHDHDELKSYRSAEATLVAVVHVVVVM